jgi:hypothetical protein
MQLPPPCYYRSTHSVLPQGWDHSDPRNNRIQRPNSRAESRQSLKIFPPCYSQVTSAGLPFSRVQFLYTVKERGKKPDRKPYSLPYGSRNPYRNLKSENSQDYAQKPQRNCTFMKTSFLQESIAHILLVGIVSTPSHPSAFIGRLYLLHTVPWHSLYKHSLYVTKFIRNKIYTNIIYT